MRRGSQWLRCMRSKWKDWLVVVLLGLVLPFTEEATTARRMEITEQMEPHIKYPFVASTVPSQAVIAYGILGPTAVVSVHAYTARISPALHHAATVGSLVSVLVSADITNVFKITVRLRSPACACLCTIPTLVGARPLRYRHGFQPCLLRVLESQLGSDAMRMPFCSIGKAVCATLRTHSRQQTNCVVNVSHADCAVWSLACNSANTHRWGDRGPISSTAAFRMASTSGRRTGRPARHSATQRTRATSSMATRAFRRVRLTLQ